MAAPIVFTLSGPDRVGIVEDVTREMVRIGANVETSRMARLGGEFAIIMMATLQGTAQQAEEAFSVLKTQGYQVTVRECVSQPAGREGWRGFTIEVDGADHEGIVHEIAAGLSGQGISIEAMETCIVQAPVTGAPLFSMRVSVAVPPELDEATWTSALTEAAAQANVDVEVTSG